MRMQKVMVLTFGLLLIASSAWAQGTTATSSDLPRTFGVGVQAGGFHLGVGATARYWSSNKMGFELGFSRYSLGYKVPGISASFSVYQIEPSVLYAFSKGDASSSVSLRPYVGGGVSIFRSSTNVSISGFGSDGSSSTDFGGQGFGGIELGFSKAPRLAISGDVGYYSTKTLIARTSLGGIAFRMAIYYFIK